MAFKDQNGKITIDEEAAERDVAALGEMSDALAGIKSKIEGLRAQSSEFTGNTGSVIAEECGAIISAVDTLSDETRESAELIRRTIAKYEQIDRDLRAMIERSGVN